MIVRIVCGGGNDPYDRDDYMETRLYVEFGNNVTWALNDNM